MSRAVTADHTLFDECINLFRRSDDYKPNEVLPFGKVPSKSVLLLPFELTQQWDLGVCIVHPSKKISFPCPYNSFISKVDNPDWIGVHDNPQLFGIALSAIISFVTQRVFKSARDDHFYHLEELHEGELNMLSLFHPILTAGPGYTKSQLSAEEQTSIEKEIKNTIELLNKVDYKKYQIIMQSMRLVHLSLINKREDFGLAYLLVVSAIESIAQKAVFRDEVKKKIPSEQIWKDKAKEDPDFLELYTLFKEARGGNAYLKERYIKFILDYAPIERWEEFVPHPNQELADTILESDSTAKVQYLLEGWRDQKIHKESEIDIIRKLLGDSYKYRSSFVHTGQQPPHKEPNPRTRFFQEYIEINEKEMTCKTIFLPNYQLLLGLAKSSILTWVEEQLI